MKKIAIFTAFAALVSFSSCEEDSLSGCTNPDVINYNAAATEDDGSCEYERNSITEVWNIKTIESLAQISEAQTQTLLSGLQTLCPGNFLIEFPNTPMPTTDTEWHEFVNNLTDNTNNLVGSGSTIEFTDTTMIINILNTVNTLAYGFSTENSITVEDPNGVYRSFDIINCDEENLILRVKFYSRDPGLEGLVVIRTFTCTP